MVQSFGEIGVTACAQFARFAVDVQRHATLDYENETLGRRAAQFPSGFKLSGVFRKFSAQCWADVHDGGTRLHSRQSRTHKSVRSQQQVIRLLRTSCPAEINARFDPCVRFWRRSKLIEKMEPALDRSFRRPRPQPIPQDRD